MPDPGDGPEDDRTECGDSPDSTEEPRDGRSPDDDHRPEDRSDDPETPTDDHRPEDRIEDPKRSTDDGPERDSPGRSEGRPPADEKRPSSDRERPPAVDEPRGSADGERRRPDRERPAAGGSPPGDRPPGDGDGPPGDDDPDAGPGGIVTTVKEVLSTAAAVAAVGLVLFAVSGVWPPLVAVESGSMEPHMYKGDLVFITEEGRYAPQEAVAGVVTHRNGTDTGYWSFGDHGNVVVYIPHTRTLGGEYRQKSATPIIHRARFFVEKGENWVRMANDSYLGSVDSCREVDNCPARHAGFVTKGDHNRVYDQVARRSTLVKPEWIRGVAKVRIPYLGCIRLQLSGDSCL